MLKPRFPRSLAPGPACTQTPAVATDVAFFLLSRSLSHVCHLRWQYCQWRSYFYSRGFGRDRRRQQKKQYQEEEEAEES